MSINEKLNELGISLSEVGDLSPYVKSYTVAGKMIYTSGLIPFNADGSIAKGKVGLDYTTEEAKVYVKNITVQLLSALNQAAGGLENIKQIVMLQCFANAVADYDEHAVLFNAASEMFTEVLGDAGKHARFALGMGSLPMNVPVEIAVTAEMKQKSIERRN